jgi:hypothetical protein
MVGILVGTAEGCTLRRIYAVCIYVCIIYAVEDTNVDGIGVNASKSVVEIFFSSNGATALSVPGRHH